MSYDPFKQKKCSVCGVKTGKLYECTVWSNIARKIQESKWICDKHRQQNSKLLQVEIGYFLLFLGFQLLPPSSPRLPIQSLTTSQIYIQYNIVPGRGEDGDSVSICCKRGAARKSFISLNAT